jgi:hypothetical protein
MQLVKPVQILVRLMPFQVNGFHDPPKFMPYSLGIGLMGCLYALELAFATASLAVRLIV